VENKKCFEIVNKLKESHSHNKLYSGKLYYRARFGDFNVHIIWDEIFLKDILA
jgi:hypothetical protein